MKKILLQVLYISLILTVPMYIFQFIVHCSLASSNELEADDIFTDEYQTTQPGRGRGDQRGRPTLSDQYKLSLNPLDFEVQGQKMVFRKCNIHTFSVSYNSFKPGNIQFFYAGGTEMYCKNDYDQEYVRHFEKIDYYQFGQSGLANYFRISGQICSNFYEVARQGFGLDGKWKIQPNNLLLQVPNKQQMVLQGCNRVTFAYKINRGGYIRITFSGSTKRACNVDNDYIFIKALQTITNYKVIKQGLELYDLERRLVATAYGDPPIQ